MIKRLILFVGVYDTLDIFTYELKKTFDQLGYETMLYDSRDTEGSLMKLAQFIQKPVTAALTFNNLGFNMELTPGSNVWEDLGIPCVNILMDHPFCYKEALDNAPSNAVVLCTDRNHMRYLNRFYPQIQVTGFLPHAGKVLPGKKLQQSERSIDIMYAGNLSKSFAANIIPELSAYKEMIDVEKFCHEVYEDVVAHPQKTTEQGIEEAFIRNGISLSDAELCQAIADFHFLDLYIVSHYRERAVAAIAKAGIRLDLFGAGWDACDWISLPNVNYHGKVSADEVVVQMQNAKMVLSTMTWFKDGTHDRVFNGMLQGAVAVSDSSVYMLEAFRGKPLMPEQAVSENQELVLFELDEIDSMPKLVQYLLDNPQIAQKIADNGYERAMNSESWESRAKELDRDLFSYMTEKRVLVVTHQLSRTGAPIVLMDMIRQCMEQGYAVDVLTMEEGPLREELEEMGIAVVLQEHFWNVREEFRDMASNYNLVIANTLITYEAVQALNNTNIPVLWWLHEGEQYFEYFKSVIPDFANIGKNVHSYAVGHYVQDVVKERYGVELPILHFAVKNAEKCDAAANSIEKSLNGPIRFLTAGTYSNVKAQDVLAEAIRMLSEDYCKKAEFYFCGNENMVDEAVFGAVTKLAEEFDNVTLLHQLTREETLQWMEQVDCLIVPSRIDPIPTVAVEMLMKKGILLCTDVCGIAHYVEDGVNGFTVPKENPQALANKLCHIIDGSRNWDDLRQSGFDIYKDHFSKDVFYNQFTQILQELGE